MAGDSDYLRLEFSPQPGLLPELSDLPRRLISVEEGHVAVHQDEPVALHIVVINRLLDLNDSLLAIVTLIGALYVVWHP